MKSKGYNLAEEFIIQHPQISQLSDSGVNTVRIITQLDKKNEVDILGARLRISVNNHVDNLASGNIAAAIDLNTGKVNGPGIYSDITKDHVDCSSGIRNYFKRISDTYVERKYRTRKTGSPAQT